MKIHETAARGYSSAADVYERGRPTYASAAVSWLCERLGIGPGRRVLALGAGTGKLTRDLVPSGATLLAVEPIDEMRAQLQAAVPSAKALLGTAEQIPLPEASVDAVLCAQAFHWFRLDLAIPEIHRVLRPGGGLGLLWNTRDVSDDLQRRIDALLEPYHQDAMRYWPDSAHGEVQASPLFGDLDHRQWPSEQHLTLEGVLAAIASRSYVATLDEHARGELLERVRAELAGEPEPITLRYVVNVYVAERLGRRRCGRAAPGSAVA